MEPLWKMKTVIIFLKFQIITTFGGLEIETAIILYTVKFSNNTKIFISMCAYTKSISKQSNSNRIDDYLDHY